jgi:hypothetical protein
MPNESFNLYKLIVLYILNKVKTPLPQRIIFDFVTSRGYTNYFTILSAFGDLLQAELILESTTYHISYYSLTRAGRETLESFGSSLSFEIRHEIDDYLKEKKYEIIEESSLVSDYHRTKDGTYLAACTLREGNHVLFHLELDVATEEDAVHVCENWREQSETLYQQAMVHLLRP